MRKRTSLVAGALVVLSLVISGCTGGSTDGSGDDAIDAVKIGSSAVTTLDYTKSNVGYGSGLGSLMLEPLLIIDADGELQPWLAESWKQPKPTVYEYHLRDGVTFSDGTKLTAQDVVFSYDYYRGDGSANSYNFPSSLRSIEAVDDRTVRVTLNEPNAAWAVVPARSQLGIFSKAFYDANRSSFGQPGTGVIGTGPWALAEFDPTSQATLTANSAYWGGAPDIQKVDWTFFSTDTSAAIAFRSGELDVYFPDENRAFSSTAGTELIAVPGAGDTGNFVMNVLVKPWNDVHVRRAVAMALDRAALVEAWGGFAEPADYFIPPTLLQQLGTADEVKTALADVPTNAFDLNAAKAEMAASAYPEGVKVTIAVADFGDSYSNVSQAIVAQLAAIGITAELKAESSEENTALALGADRTAILAQYATYGAVSADPGDAFNYAIGSANATKGNWNGTNWSNDKVDRLIGEGFATNDPAKRLSIYAQMNNEFAVNVPSVPLFQFKETLALSDSLQWTGFDALWTSRGPWLLGITPKS
ncbi:ABC transporter substrate-binding protein [Acrocarpospora catenulata]|uniref:ABC transporter substrate-binding protein n=1 Tax=Acrocarpospora catenulata TaxID=2836182 RepID=UPI001BDAFAA2|nr:ABC transporter substrate-binding protein [Acrocarpospora catenulata]